MKRRALSTAERTLLARLDDCDYRVVQGDELALARALRKRGLVSYPWSEEAAETAHNTRGLGGVRYARRTLEGSRQLLADTLKRAAR